MITEVTHETASTRPARAKAAKPQMMHTCPECGERFKGAYDQRFCTTKHRHAFHNRSGKRGVVMMPLMLAWRRGRGSGDTAKWAYGEMCRLADIWNAEDKAAGRMAPEVYIRDRRANGWSAVDYAFG